MTNLITTPLDSQSQIIENSEISWKPGTGMITVRTVHVRSIIADPAYQMRFNGTDPALVEKYAAIMKQHDPDGWTQFPLIRVFVPKADLPDVNAATDSDQFKEMLDAPPDQYKIVSGFHRHAAMLLNGYDEIQVELMYGDDTEALVVALGQNADRSQIRTQDDIRKIMEFCLTHPEIRSWNNHQIARWAQVDPQTVTNHEKRLMSTPNFVFEPRPAKLKFIDKHGNISLRKHTPPRIDDLEPEGTREFALNKIEKAFLTYKERKESIGLSDLPWAGEKEDDVDFLSYAEAEFERQGKKLGYVSDEMSTNQLSELAKLWESLTNAIKHNANWIQAIAREEARKAEIDEDVQLRKTLLDEIMHLQVHQVSPLLPEQFKDEWKASKDGLKAAYPLYFSYPNRNNLPIETLKKMKNTLLRMKKDLQENGITKFLSEEGKERATAHGELTQAYQNAQNAFNAHPLAELMEFDDFEQEAEFRLELEEGLLSPDFVGGLEPKDIRHHKHLWDKVAKGLEQNVRWVQKALSEAEEVKARVAAFESAHASMERAEASFLQNRDALGLAGVSWDDFKTKATIEFKRRSLKLMTPLEKGYSIDHLHGFGKAWDQLTKEITLPAHDWIKECVETLNPTSEENLQSLKAEVHDLFDEGIGNEAHALALSHVHEIPLPEVEKVIAQVRADFDAQAETESVDTTSFDELESNTRVTIRVLAHHSNLLLQQQDAPEPIRTAASELMHQIKAFVKADTHYKRDGCSTGILEDN